MTSLFQSISMRSTATNLLVRSAFRTKCTPTAGINLPQCTLSTQATSTSATNSNPNANNDHFDIKSKISNQQQQQQELRFDYTGLPVSDRVRKLLDLTNGSKREVVKAQKKQGMQLFQLREGDTGSSAVQGSYSLLTTHLYHHSPFHSILSSLTFTNV